MKSRIASESRFKELLKILSIYEWSILENINSAYFIIYGLLSIFVEKIL